MLNLPLHLGMQVQIQLVSCFSESALTRWLDHHPPFCFTPRAGFLLNQAPVQGLELLRAVQATAHLNQLPMSQVSACACCLGALPLRTALLGMAKKGLAEVLVISTHWPHLPRIAQQLISPTMQPNFKLGRQILVLGPEEWQSNTVQDEQKPAKIQRAIGDWQCEWVLTD